MVSIETIREAARRIAPYAHRTPILTSRYFNQQSGADLRFKCECFQKGGAFKFRGACNTVFCLSETEARCGVVTHSSGNHAQALALAAKLRGIDATVVMPKNASAVKRQAVEGYGARIVLCKPTLHARESTAAEVIEQDGGTLVHAYNDDRIISGQGTAALELIEDAGPLDLIMAPVGGGGLLSGTACAGAALCPQGLVIGIEPEAADDAQQSFRAGRIIPATDPDTIADGLRTSLGDRTFPIIRQFVNDIVMVSEREIVAAMRLVWQRMKIIIEPSSAVPVAAILQRKVDVSGKRVGVILSGGNVDLDDLPWAG